MQGQHIGSSPMMKSYENYAESPNSKQRNNLLTIPKTIVTLMQTEETESDDYGNIQYPMTERNKISNN